MRQSRTMGKMGKINHCPGLIKRDRITTRLISQRGSSSLRSRYLHLSDGAIFRRQEKCTDSTRRGMSLKKRRRLCHGKRWMDGI